MARFRIDERFEWLTGPTFYVRDTATGDRIVTVFSGHEAGERARARRDELEVLDGTDDEAAPA